MPSDKRNYETRLSRLSNFYVYFKKRKTRTQRWKSQVYCSLVWNKRLTCAHNRRVFPGLPSLGEGIGWTSLDLCPGDLGRDDFPGAAQPPAPARGHHTPSGPPPRHPGWGKAMAP